MDRIHALKRWFILGLDIILGQFAYKKVNLRKWLVNFPPSILTAKTPDCPMMDSYEWSSASVSPRGPATITRTQPQRHWMSGLCTPQPSSHTQHVFRVHPKCRQQDQEAESHSLLKFTFQCKQSHVVCGYHIRAHVYNDGSPHRAASAW